MPESRQLAVITVSFSFWSVLLSQ